MMATQTNFNSAAFTLGDPWSLHIQQTYGGRGINDVQPYWDMAGYKRTLGKAEAAPSGTWSTGSGVVQITEVGKGSTPSNPGGYNYGTLKNVVNTTATAVRGAVGITRTLRRANDQNKARQWQQLQTNYRNAWDPNMDYSGSYQAAANAQLGTGGNSPAMTVNGPTTGVTAGQVSSIKSPKNPVEAANKGIQEWQRQRSLEKEKTIEEANRGIQEWRRGRRTSTFPKPGSPVEAANKGIGDMLRGQKAESQKSRLGSSALYKVNKSLRESFPDFYNPT